MRTLLEAISELKARRGQGGAGSMTFGTSFWARRVGALSAILLILLGSAASLEAQEAEPIERPGPPPSEDFETDADGDGLPDGWYNVRDAQLAEGGIGGTRCLRFRNDLPGRPARASQAFGVDGRESDTLLIGLWVKADAILPSERVGEEPSLILGFFDDQLRPVAQRVMGPWTDRSLGNGWVRVASRIPVPPSSRDVILTLGLFGATGTLDVDGLTIEPLPRGGQSSTNFVVNGDFELGNPHPDAWELGGEARRAFPGSQSNSCLELVSAASRAETGLAIPVDRFRGLEIRLNARATGLRASGGAFAEMIYLDRNGRPLRAASPALPRLRWAGSFDWREFREVAPVPPAARWALLRIQKPSAGGRLQIDDVRVSAAPDADAGRWTPFQVTEETSTWPAYEATNVIEPGSALDASHLLQPPAGSQGRVRVDNGRLVFESGQPARFFGVSLFPPLAFPTNERALAIAERLARSGVNLARLGAIDAPIGAGLSLFDDSRDDTRAFDPIALPRFESLIDALKSRGVYVALELQAMRRFREGDDLEGYRGLPPGGGPAAAFDESIRERSLETARSLLEHVNPETGLALRDDPVLAWVALAGELSLFDLIDQPDALPAEFQAKLRHLTQESRLGAGRRAWQALESAHWQAEVAALREFGLKAPVAGSSHWRREPEFVAAQTVSGLDIVEDRLYWAPSRWVPPDRRAMLWDADRVLLTEANRKRKGDRPFVVGEWASQTRGAWALPYEAGDLILMSALAATNEWDALVRRGVALHPEVWGFAAPGTSGESDVAEVPEAINAMPPAFALLPHAASIYLRRGENGPRVVSTPGQVAVEARHTQVLAGWADGRSFATEVMELESLSEFSVVAVSSVGDEPLASADRLLVTLVGRAFPSNLRWVDQWRREVADPGSPPLLMEPVRARVTWKRQGPANIQAFALNNDGSRAEPVNVQEVPGGGVRVDLRGGATLHWELVVTTTE